MARLDDIAHEISPSGPDTPGKAPTLSELSIVSLVHDLEVDGRTFPVGARGTVVAAYADGKGYEVEVFDPFHGVITVEAESIAG